MEITLDARRLLVQQAVYLDGAPARIVGVRLQFARVVTLDGDRSGEWSWISAARICAEGGQFRM